MKRTIAVFLMVLMLLTSLSTVSLAEDAKRIISFDIHNSCRIQSSFSLKGLYGFLRTISEDTISATTQKS